MTQQGSATSDVAGRIFLHDYWRSTASYRVRIALALKGIAYDSVGVNLVAGQQRSEAHLQLNPQGLVPVLEIHGRVFSQSVAIIEYLEERFPATPLLPAEPDARAHVRALAMAIACDIHPISNLAVLMRVEDLAGPEARKVWNQDNISKGLTAFEKMLDHPGFSGDFCYANTPGMADCVLIPQLYNATRWGVGYDHLPRITAVMKRCENLAPFQAAHPDHAALSPQASIG